MSKKQSKATRQANAQRAAERAAELRRQQEKKDRRRRTMLIGGVVVGVLALIVGIFAFVQATRDTPGDNPGQVSGAPSGAVDDYALTSDETEAPVTVEVYEDFMCPACGDFEAMAAETLQEYDATEDVQVRYLPISILDRLSNGTDYSTRSVNAVAVVLDEAGPEAALELHDALFANQPTEGTEGLSDTQLVDLAVEAGAERADIAEPIENLKFEKWVSDATEASQQAGVQATPTVVVNGEQLEDNSLQSLTAAIEEAQGGD